MAFPASVIHDCTCRIGSVVRIGLGLDLQTAAVADGGRDVDLTGPPLARLYSFAGSKAAMPACCQTDWSGAVLAYLLGPGESQLGPNGAQVLAQFSDGGKEVVVYLQSASDTLVSNHLSGCKNQCPSLPSPTDLSQPGVTQRWFASD